MKTLLSTSTIYKLLLSVLMVTMLSGCVTKYVYIEAQCPHIEVLSAVPPIGGPLDMNGNIQLEYVKPLLQGCSDLRKSEMYYIDAINTYNKDYNTSK